MRLHAVRLKYSPDQDMQFALRMAELMTELCKLHDVGFARDYSYMGWRYKALRF